MRFLAFTLASLALAGGAFASAADDFVVVEGGRFAHPRSLYHAGDTTVSTFAIARHEVTQREWLAVMDHNPSRTVGDDLPVDSVTWYDCIEYCNRRSLREGREPYYTITKDRPDPANTCESDELKWTITTNPRANGYRLPTEAEWEYAASGGRLSKGHSYSGGDDPEKVAWYWRNSGKELLAGLWNWPAVEQNGNKPQRVGSKAPNELGLHDMSGNVREWCWDWRGHLEAATHDPQGPPRGNARVWKGGGWMGADFCCEPFFRGSHEPSSTGPDQGFRVVRGAR